LKYKVNRGIIDPEHESLRVDDANEVHSIIYNYDLDVLNTRVSNIVSTWQLLLDVDGLYKYSPYFPNLNDESMDNYLIGVFSDYEANKNDIDRFLNEPVHLKDKRYWLLRVFLIALDQPEFIPRIKTLLLGLKPNNKDVVLYQHILDYINKE